MTGDPATHPGDTADAPGEDLHALAGRLRDNPALRAKAEIALVGEELGGEDWWGGPGDDGAVVPVGDGGREVRAVACGEALLPAFVAKDPFGAGLAAMVANVNDLAAMGARPSAIVNTIAAGRPVARELLRGLRRGSEIYDVPLVGGHLTIHDGAPSLSAFGLGWAREPLSATRLAAGQSLVLAACVEGSMREDFPFFASFAERGDRLAEDVRLLADLADAGVCVGAKDVSMAGIVGSLAMLLEHGRYGCAVDLGVLPRPAGVPLGGWLMCFPAYAFLLAVPAGREDECLDAFLGRGLAAATIGVLDDSGLLSLVHGAEEAVVLDLGSTPVTGLPVPSRGREGRAAPGETS